MTKITKEESLLLQSLSTTALLLELNKANFLGSDYFKTLKFDSNDCKKILMDSGLGNPAIMQIMLYALLIIPREILSRDDYSELEYYSANINPLVYTLIENETYSSYKNEQSNENINYIRHIRNAVAHSKLDFTTHNQVNYVVFNDNNENTGKCSIKIECSKIRFVLMELQKIIINYCNKNH